MTEGAYVHKLKAVGASLALLVSLLVVGQGASPAPVLAAASAGDKETTLKSPPVPTGAAAKGTAIKGDPHAANKAKAAKLGRKSVPPQAASLKETPTDVYWKYAQGSQTLTTASTGVNALMTVSSPYINPAYDWHTLAELAVISTIGGTRQIVEVGWTKDNATYGDNNPHLFAYHWVNDVESCYDGCGYVDLAAETTIYAGMPLTSALQTDKQFGIERGTDRWFLSYNGTYFGSFPDTLWTGATPAVTTYKQVDRLQAFGELAAGSDTASCADMGIGPGPTYPPTMATSGTATVPATGAKINSVTYTGRPNTDVNLAYFSTTPTKWNTAIPYGNTGARSFRFAGIGYC